VSKSTRTSKTSKADISASAAKLRLLKRLRCTLKFEKRAWAAGAQLVAGVDEVGRGSLFGPVVAAFVLTLIPADLIFLNIDPNFGQVIQGTLIVLVVMLGGFFTLARSRK